MDPVTENALKSAATLGEISEVVTNNLESEISFEELIISWSHGYTRKGMPCKTCRMSKGMEAGMTTGWLWRARAKKHEEMQWDKDFILQRKETCIPIEKLNSRFVIGLVIPMLPPLSSFIQLIEIFKVLYQRKRKLKNKTVLYTEWKQNLFPDGLFSFPINVDHMWLDYSTSAGRVVSENRKNEYDQRDYALKTK